MKRTHACPKCGCTQIVHVPASQWLFARGGNAYLGLHLGEKVLISKYICTGCSYVENWAERPQDLAALGGRVFNTALEKCLQWRPAG